MAETLDVLKKRSSTRGYTSEKLSEEILNKLLEAGLQAPTAANRQEIHFSVVDGSNPVLAKLEEEKNNLRGISAQEKNFYFSAPTVIFLSADKDYYWSPLDAGIAVENIAIAAESLGLGSLIIGCVKDALRGKNESFYAKELAFPENYRYEIAIAVGYKGVEKEPHTYSYENNVTIVG